MTDQLESELRLLFAEESEQAPAAVALANGARRRVRQRRQSRLAWGAGALVAASVAAVAGLGGGPLNGSPAREQAVAHSPESRPTGALPGGEMADCVYAYSPPLLRDRAFAFDGTVISIGPAHTDRPGSILHVVGATFAVSEWFVGGSGPTVTIDMTAPGGTPRVGESPPAYGELPPDYEIGSRLLVSGAHRWDGTTMADAIAWGCGFTRYYDKSTADSWREATR
jgi:hypothetical protein